MGVSDWREKNSKGERTTWMRDVRRHIAAIEAWRSQLPIEERVRLSHPRTIWEHFKKAQTKATDLGEPVSRYTAIPLRHPITQTSAPALPEPPEQAPPPAPGVIGHRKEKTLCPPPPTPLNPASCLLLL